MAALVPQYFEEEGDKKKKEIRLHHLLDMTSGLHWIENGAPTGEWAGADIQAVTIYRFRSIAHLASASTTPPPRHTCVRDPRVADRNDDARFCRAACIRSDRPGNQRLVAEHERRAHRGRGDPHDCA